MSTEFELDAKVRTEAEQGKGASRRLRKQLVVPGIIYGADKPPVAITIPLNQLKKSLLYEAFFSHVLKILIEGGEEEQVVIKDLQRHPAKGYPMHVDFQRIVKGQQMQIRVPIHFVGEEASPGKKEGGVLSTLVSDIEISCLPSKLPEYLEVSVANLAIGDSLHLSDITLPEGVTIPELEIEEGTDRTIVNMQPPRLEETDQDEDTDEEDAEAVDDEEDADDSESENEDDQ